MNLKIIRRLLLKQTSQSKFNIPLFLVVFALLTGCFYVYIGITSPGGKTYSSFLDHYLNVADWLAWLIAKISFSALKLTGFAVYQRTPNNVTITGSRGVTILWACLGVGVMSFWTAFVIAHRGSWQFRLRWCVTGLGLITALNITRIVLIALANHYHWRLITVLDAHATFNIVSYLLLFVLIGWFIIHYEQQQKKLTAYSTKAKTAFPAVSV